MPGPAREGDGSLAAAPHDVPVQPTPDCRRSMSAGQDPRRRTRRGLAGRVLGDRYRVARMVSAGANTLIADAEDLELDRPVTVKLVRPEWAESAEFRRRFAAAMRTMSTLSHRNIAAVYDWGEEEVGKRTTVYAVVEHLSGGSLRDLFDRGRYLDPSQALVVGLEACRGLDFAHRKGLVHTELTPSKLVFGDDRRLRIVDFGLARLLGADDWQEPATVATHVARYSSPEQALGQPIDGKTDVYSLALILVEAVTGTVPFAARSTVATLSARVGRLMPVSADLGPLAAVLEQAGRPDPADRSTAAELGRSLVRAAEKLPRPTPIPIARHGAVRRRPQPDAPAQRPDRRASPVRTTLRRQPRRSAAPADRSPPTPEERAADASLDRRRRRRGAADRRRRRCRRPAEPPTAAVGCTTATPTAPSDELGRAAGRPTSTAGRRRPAVAAPSAGRHGVRRAGRRPRSRRRRRRRWLPWRHRPRSCSPRSPGSALLALQLFEVPTHPVPELVGLDEAAARAQTADFDWDIDVQTERSDEQPDRRGDHPHRTGRRRGARRGRAVPRRRQRGPGVPPAPRPRRPDPSPRPRRRSPSCSLVALPATEQHDEDVPPGSVISWSVPADPSLGAGGEVLPGARGRARRVDRPGPADRARRSSGRPSRRRPRRWRRSSSCRPSPSRCSATTSRPAASCPSTRPPARSVARGTTVTMVPSKGVDLVTMPDLSRPDPAPRRRTP